MRRLVLLLALAACGDPPERTPQCLGYVSLTERSYDPAEWTPEERATLHRAFQRVARFTGAPMALVEASPACAEPEPLLPTDGGVFFGESPTKPTMVAADRIRDNRLSLETVVIHEVLHSFGLGHVQGRAIMTEKATNQSTLLNELDRQSCIKARVYYPSLICNIEGAEDE